MQFAIAKKKTYVYLHGRHAASEGVAPRGAAVALNIQYVWEAPASEEPSAARRAAARVD